MVKVVIKDCAKYDKDKIYFLLKKSKVLNIASSVSRLLKKKK